MKNHRYSNKRITGRSVNGRFQKTTFRDLAGVDFNELEQECLDCGFRWTPIVLSGRCHNQKCQSMNTQTVPPPPEIQEKIKRYAEIKLQNPNGIHPFNHRLQAEASDLFRAILKYL